MSANIKSTKELGEEARGGLHYSVQGAILDFTEDVVRTMQAQNLTKSALAAKLGTSPAYVTKVLSGSTNFTLETMVRIAKALDAELRVHLQPSGAFSQWFDYPNPSAQTEGCGAHIIDWRAVQDSPTVPVISSRTKVSNEELPLAS